MLDQSKERQRARAGLIAYCTFMKSHHGVSSYQCGAALLHMLADTIQDVFPADAILLQEHAADIQSPAAYVYATGDCRPSGYSAYVHTILVDVAVHIRKLLATKE